MYRESVCLCHPARAFSRPGPQSRDPSSLPPAERSICIAFPYFVRASIIRMPAPQPLLEPLSTDHLQTDLKGRSVRGGVLTISVQGAQFLIQSVSTMVLARLLMPADFGLVAMVAVVTGLGQSFADLGLSEATIQREEISRDQVSTLFWINAAVGLTLMLAVSAFAPVLAWFYREPRIKDITYLLSLTFLIGGLRVQHDALLKRQMRFVSLALRDLLACALSVLVGVGMARRGAGYWALVVSPLAFNATVMLLSWLMVRWTPGLPRRGVKVASLIAFGGNTAASYIVCSLNRTADNILIGWHLGAGPLGFYSRACNLVMMPVLRISAPVGSVAVPALSRVQSDPERFARYYLRVVGLMAWISGPILGFLFVAAEPVIVVMLGNRWRESAPVFRILAVSAFGQLLLESIIWLLVSRGESKRLRKLMSIVSPIIVGSFLMGLPFGIKGVALSGSLVLVGIFPWMLKFAFRGTLLTLREIGQAIACPISLCLTGVLFAELALRLVAPHRTSAQFLVVALGFATAYSLSSMVPRVRNEVMSLKRLSSELVR
jgi:O-antigen/teichoic acid export membrane protein